ncbi:hypothetical protein R1T08_34775 [Streptomyces sp. SBC-4]|nr:hypothetical protein [Streptomyces sp. SBC-4]MDV5149165.1 hypothetical protein [Streptomyces sp. SBC-4]
MGTTARGTRGPETTDPAAGVTPATAGRTMGRAGPRRRGGRGPDGSSAGLPGRTRAREGKSFASRLRLPRHRAWGTLPARLRLLRTAILLLAAACAALLITAALAASDTRDAVTGQHAPRTVSASGLNLALNDMDAQAVNSLLANGDAGKGRTTVPYGKAVQLYDEAREAVSHDLRVLAVVAEGDDTAERTVERLTTDFARYQEFIGRALESDTRTGGKPAAIENYRTASDLLTQRLLPEARSLVEADNGRFEDAYADRRSDLAARSALLLALGTALLAVLALLQWYLARRFRRVLNPGLLAATLCALLAVVLGSQALSDTAEQLRVARRDAFDSIVALSRARAIAYDANADESRYLLDKDHRAEHEAAFLAKSQSLYGMKGADLASYEPLLTETWRAYRADHADKRFRSGSRGGSPRCSPPSS